MRAGGPWAGIRRFRSELGPALFAILLVVCSSCVPVGRSLPPSAADPADTVAAARNEPEEFTRVRWLRIHGIGDETSPPILRIPIKGEPASTIGSNALTIEFDMQADRLPNLTLILVHCDRNWTPTENVFVQDPIKLRSSDFEISRSPVGVRGYDYSCSISFPSSESTIKVEYSGNYIARIVDYYDNKRVLAETRFFAVEPKGPVGVGVGSGFYESAQTSVLQNGVNIRVEALVSDDLFASQIRQISLYESGMWDRPMIASDEVSGQPRKAGEYWSIWSSFFGGKAIAQFNNIPSGNEHRLLDLTDLALFPSTANGVTTTPLSDLPRQGYSELDHGGTAVYRFVPLSEAEYVYFEFRLDLKGYQVHEDICVVGTFNNWTPTRDWRMVYDKASGNYIARGWIKRALHEYQYVSGRWDEDEGVLANADPTLIEGNVSSTSHPYYALTYYRETTGGGYDRIIGVGGVLTGDIR